MLLAAYTSTRPGWQGIANRIIRVRLSGRVSHCEIVTAAARRLSHGGAHA